MSFFHEQFDYWRQIRHDSLKSHPELSYILQFLAVGFLGFCLNMLVLTFTLMAGAGIRASLISGITASTLFNFTLDRHIVFSYASHRGFLWQFLGFILTCVAGAWINYSTAMAILTACPKLLPHLAELAGIIVATAFNYVVLRYAIFRK